MTSGTSTDRKEVIFVNQAAFRDYAELPREVKEAADARTTILQNGGGLPAKQVSNLKGKLAGISEIRILHDDDTYRVYFAAEYDEAIYILDAGIKKSPRKFEIPQWQVDRLVERKRKADEHYAANKALLEARAKARSEAREAQADTRFGM